MDPHCCVCARLLFLCALYRKQNGAKYGIWCINANLEYICPCASTHVRTTLGTYKTRRCPSGRKPSGLPDPKPSPLNAQDTYVGEFPSWVFTSLFICGLLTLWIAIGYAYFWQDYVLPRVAPCYPLHPDDIDHQDPADAVDQKTKNIEMSDAPTPPTAPLPPQQSAPNPMMPVGMPQMAGGIYPQMMMVPAGSPVPMGSAPPMAYPGYVYPQGAGF
mmetsp:Transcript_36423/g.91623  ORF Transcript_36423/g.91623 Transcript_36423/m.91623 type:complete len:216 (+) Transcript_36423:813-1460(+)